VSAFVAFTLTGLVIGAAYAIAASGLVVTYATSNVFNIAHGAIGMVMAFAFWELHGNRGIPTAVALVLVVGILAPLFGALVERLMMRRLTEAPVAVSLVVTVALLVGLIGLAQTLWPPTGRRFEEFFPGSGVRLGELFVTAHQLITFAVAGLVAGGLYALLNRTRTGTAMRALVDNRELLALHGARPDRFGSLSWALGSGLAALAGILLAPQVGLDYLPLTLLVVNAYAAAMVGRLTNLGGTFVGALALGLLQSYFLYGLRVLPDDLELGGLLQGMRVALPTLFLFAVMLLLPQDTLRVGRPSGTTLPPLPSWTRTVLCGTGLLLGIYAVTGLLSEADTARLGQALALSLVMLSLVLVTGYGGDVSLCQLTFAGVGALVVGRLFDGLTPMSVVMAGVVTAGVGALVALPTLRLRGLYLALGTLAFAVAMDNLVFQTQLLGFGETGSLIVERPSVLGLSLASERAFTVTVGVAFAVMAAGVLAVRRGRFGRFLLAARDSETACATLGFNPRAVRVAVFALSSGLAGIAGAFYAGMRVSVSSVDFVFFLSLPLLLLAVVGGVTSITGALLGGLTLGLLPVLQEQVPALAGLAFVLVGVAAVRLSRSPNGLAGALFGAPSRFGPRTPAARPREGGVLVGSA
jgi:branched-chain amino acid transport system permease protein